MDAATGQDEWSLPGAYGNFIASDNVLFAIENGQTVAISLQTHNVLWSLPTAGNMAVSDSELFIGADGSVTAYAVPEPSSFLLLVPATEGLPLRRRHRR